MRPVPEAWITTNARDFKSCHIWVQKLKAIRKGRVGLHAIVLKLCRVEIKQEDVMVTAEANEANGSTRECFSSWKGKARRMVREWKQAGMRKWELLKRIMRICEVALALRRVEHTAGLDTSIFCASGVRWGKEEKTKEEKIKLLFHQTSVVLRGFGNWSQGGDSHCGYTK